MLPAVSFDRRLSRQVIVEAKWRNHEFMHLSFAEPLPGTHPSQGLFRVGVPRGEHLLQHPCHVRPGDGFRAGLGGAGGQGLADDHLGFPQGLSRKGIGQFQTLQEGSDGPDGIPAHRGADASYLAPMAARLSSIAHGRQAAQTTPCGWP